jgi:hypothetical protein
MRDPQPMDETAAVGLFFVGHRVARSSAFNPPKEIVMIKHALAIAISAVLMLAAPVAIAQTAAPAAKTDAKAKTDTNMKSAAPAEAKPEKKLTAQQQKMKDCGAKWQDEKKAKNVSGKAAYQKFLSTCLKG